MDKNSVLLGFWYDAIDKKRPLGESEIIPIKVTREHFITSGSGWQIMTKRKGSDVSLFWSKNLDDCLNYIEEHFTVARPYKSTRVELTKDIEFLEREVHPKNWEIVQHIKYILENILGD